MKSPSPLIALLFVASSAFAHPFGTGYGESQDKCMNVLLTLCDITYQNHTIYSTPAHLADSGASVSFQLKNSVLPYTTNCYANNSLVYGSFSNELEPFECDFPDDAPDGACATFTFDEPTGTFQVNQTFTCAGQQQQHSATYIASAVGGVDLDCNTETCYTKNWTIGENYSVTNTTCTPVTLDGLNAMVVQQ